MKKPKIHTSEFNVPKLRHFTYKNKSTNQYVYPYCEVPYHTAEKRVALLQLYSQLYQQVNTPSRPLKLLFQQLKTESVLGWVRCAEHFGGKIFVNLRVKVNCLFSFFLSLSQDTKGFELYLIFEPFVTKQEAINAVNKVLKCIKKEEDRLFANVSTTF